MAVRAQTLVIGGAIVATALGLSAPATPASSVPAHRQSRLHQAHAQRTAQKPQPGRGVIVAISPTIRLSGLPLDWNGLPFSVNSGRGIELKLPTNPIAPAIYASNLPQTSCKQRLTPYPTQSNPGWQWVPVPATFLRAKDQVIVQLDASKQAASADARAGTLVPASWIYDVC